MKTKPKSKSKTAYMCGIAWQHEIGETDVEVFPTRKLCEGMHADDECGIVEVKVTFVRWVKNQKL